MPAPGVDRLFTISQLAAFAGVTVRAVRHYHARGLLPEPARDASGYRRYDARDAVELIRIKTLADAGVPLARVGTLLRAEPAEFADAIAEIDRRLRETIRQTREHRRRVARLAVGDGLALPSPVVDYLARLRECGVSERSVSIERDGWILLSAYAPDRVADWIRLKTEALDDPQFRALYLGFDLAHEWQPDDPRLVELADAIASYTRTMAGLDDPARPIEEEFDETIVAILNTQFIQASPALRRLGELVQQRGVSYWTDAGEADT
ncbi:MAG: MerR family transcriptional regulator [Gaiellales bacterium]